MNAITKLNTARKKTDKILTKLVKYRWIIALIIFILCVAFKLHGSSIGIYDGIFPTHISEADAQKYHILGGPQIIRGDEFVVHTPTYFSQYYNGFNKYSQQMSMHPTNMVLDYYAPVKDITLLCKPFNWGYILFGNERGLSFYWCGQMIMLFMAAFEMFYILTKKNKLLSFVGMFMVGFSPAMQWWMIPHMPIVFIYAMTLFDLGYYMLTSQSKVKQWILTVVTGFIAAGFALSIFPSCQIVAGLAVAVLLITCLIRDRKDIGIYTELEKEEIKKNTINMIIKIAVAGFIAIAILIYFLLTSREDFKLLTGTTYPGKRVSLGQYSTISDLFTGLRSLTLSYRESNVLNNSEVATFIHFTPLFLCLFPSLARRLRKENTEDTKMDLLIGKSLFLLLLLEIVFMGIGFTPRLAKITLFSYINRMQMGYGFTGVIFNVWSINTIWKHKEYYKKWQLILATLLFAFVYEMTITVELRGYLKERYLLVEIIGLSVIVFMAMMRYRKLFAVGMCSVMIIAGAFVNPICSGISPITNHPISKVIRETSEKDPEHYWVTADATYITSNFVMANGAKSLSSTNFYPDFDKWKILDPKGKNEDVYNRYANMVVEITDKRTKMHNISPDAISLRINANDLLKLKVKYIMTSQKVEKIFKKENITYKKLITQDGYTIYEISKKK